MEYIEQWGALGVFIASVIPFVDAIAMVPVGIALGVNPTLTVIAAVIGDAIAIPADQISVLANMSVDARNGLTPAATDAIAAI